jgi:sRNA-binding carbon storage regulator CsrA
MLMLTQGIEDSVHIFLPDGRQVVVKLCQIKGGKASIGYVAPTDVRIFRETVALASGLIGPDDLLPENPESPTRNTRDRSREAKHLRDRIAKQKEEQ